MKLYNLFIFSTIDANNLVYFFDNLEVAKQAEKIAKKLYKNKEVDIKLEEFNPTIIKKLSDIETELKDSLEDFEDVTYFCLDCHN